MGGARRVVLAQAVMPKQGYLGVQVSTVLWVELRTSHNKNDDDNNDDDDDDNNNNNNDNNNENDNNIMNDIMII